MPKHVHSDASRRRTRIRRTALTSRRLRSNEPNRRARDLGAVAIASAEVDAYLVHTARGKSPSLHPVATKAKDAR
jgi:hypothetical protein